MRVHRTTIGAAVLVLALATSALAVTVAELLSQATSLESTFDSLTSRANACPGGACADRPSIQSDLAAAEAARTALENDRATLSPCSNCSTLDAEIGSVDAKAAAARSTIGGWDSQG